MHPLTAVIIMVVLGEVAFWSWGKYREALKETEGFDPADLLTDMVQGIMIEGELHVVVTKFLYEEDDDRWVEYKLSLQSNYDRIRWLCVEPYDDGIELSLYDVVDDFDAAGDLPETMEYHGVEYALDERGVAEVRTDPPIGDDPMFVPYSGYAAGGGRLFLVESRFDVPRAAVGRVLSPGVVDFPDDEDWVTPE